MLLCLRGGIVIFGHINRFSYLLIYLFTNHCHSLCPYTLLNFVNHSVAIHSLLTNYTNLHKLQSRCVQLDCCATVGDV